MIDLDKSNVTEVMTIVATLQWIEERMGDEGLETVKIDKSFEELCLKGHG